MSLVSDVITDIRVEINDTQSTRFPDNTTTILPILKQAIRRANRICQRGQLHFAKKSATLTTTGGQAYVTAPADLDVPIGIWRDDLHEKLTQRTEGDWEQLIFSGGVYDWFLDLQNNRIQLSDTPTDTLTLTMWYFPKVDPSAYTAASTMPWDGRLDDIIARYVAYRIQNIEEQDTTQDQAILSDMEQSILSVYSPLNPQKVEMKGWL